MTKVKESAIATVRRRDGESDILARPEGDQWRLFVRDEAGDVTASHIDIQRSRRAVSIAIVAAYGPAAEFTGFGEDWVLEDPDVDRPPRDSDEPVPS